jgi:hypothetical protein
MSLINICFPDCTRLALRVKRQSILCMSHLFLLPFNSLDDISIRNTVKSTLSPLVLVRVPVVPRAQSLGSVVICVPKWLMNALEDIIPSHHDPLESRRARAWMSSHKDGSLSGVAIDIVLCGHFFRVIDLNGKAERSAGERSMGSSDFLYPCSRGI